MRGSRVLQILSHLVNFVSVDTEVATQSSTVHNCECCEQPLDFTIDLDIQV